VQEAAYQSLLNRTRLQLHARVVDVLVVDFPERVATEPELVARHAEAAGRVDDAVACLERAGEHAQARSANEEAIAHLRHAIALLATRPESVERDGREAALQLSLIGSLRATRGNAHPETEAAYERAVAAGLAFAAQTGQRLNEAFLHGLEGEILRKSVEGSAVENEKAAEKSFRCAIDIARAQEAESLELRAATSLARLRRDQDKGAAARDLLAPVYARFTEGFDTLDLLEANALLHELSA
jgi:predicted ATPase